MEINSQVAQAKIFHDFKGLHHLKGLANSDDSQDQLAASKEVATQFESFFLSMMLKSMRNASSTGEGGLFQSNDMKMYQSMFDQQISTSLAKESPLQLADLMVSQIKVSQGLSNELSGSSPTSLPVKK